MTEFEKRCAEACQGCRHGYSTYWDSSKRFHTGEGRPDWPCTAPTESQYIEELVKEIARLRIEKMAWEIDTERVIEIDQRNGVLANQRNELAEERDSLKAQVEKLTKLHDTHFADAMIAHRWFSERFGEQMNGRDFAIKCPMATEALEQQQQEIEALLQERTEDSKMLDWLGSKDCEEFWKADDGMWTAHSIREAAGTAATPREAIRTAMEGES